MDNVNKIHFRDAIGKCFRLGIAIARLKRVPVSISGNITVNTVYTITTIIVFKEKSEHT